ncbi:HNH endonuclease [Maricaulis maris]|jgi:hypothetical protein|uniref:HNH endonuclease n=1 Tax=Maricaulis maris TaxID=74318 RepID=UPI003A8EE019
MDEQDQEFFAPRQCFLPPPNSIGDAAAHFDAAVDLLIQGKLEEARSHIAATDRNEHAEFAQLIAGTTVQSIHRVRIVDDAPPFDRSKAERMPSARDQFAIFGRDGWRCRFCGVKVINRTAIKLLDRHFPDLIRWSGKARDMNGSVRIMAVSLDHIIPHSRGGSNEERNLVTACGPCQFGRSSWTLAEVGFSDPRKREPIVDEWDGLSRLV